MPEEACLFRTPRSTRRPLGRNTARSPDGPMRARPPPKNLDNRPASCSLFVHGIDGGNGGAAQPRTGGARRARACAGPWARCAGAGCGDHRGGRGIGARLPPVSRSVRLSLALEVRLMRSGSTASWPPARPEPARSAPRPKATRPSACWTNGRSGSTRRPSTRTSHKTPWKPASPASAPASVFPHGSRQRSRIAALHGTAGLRPAPRTPS